MDFDDGSDSSPAQLAVHGYVKSFEFWSTGLVFSVWDWILIRDF